MAIESGTHIGPYEVVGHLGAGGMGVVYRAHDRSARWPSRCFRRWWPPTRTGLRASSARRSSCGDSSGVFVKPVPGPGKARQMLPVPEGERYLVTGFSPDGTELLLTHTAGKGSEAEAVSIAGGKPRGLFPDLPVTVNPGGVAQVAPVPRRQIPPAVPRRQGPQSGDGGDGNHGAVPAGQ